MSVQIPEHLRKKGRIAPEIPQPLIDDILERLASGKRIRRNLEPKGRVHIDRPLPFLLLYRRPPKQTDQGTAELVKGEASYLIVSGHGSLKRDLTQLLRGIVTTLGKEYQAFLILEIWSRSPWNDKESPDTTISASSRPAFRIVSSQLRPSIAVLEVLEEALKRIRIHRKSATVEIVSRKTASAPGLLPLLSQAEAKKLRCFFLGLEIDAIYQAPDTGEIFPMLLKQLHHGLTTAIKKALFEFSQNQTAHSPVNYQALGRRAMVKAVWETDRKLAELDSSFDFLLLVTPVNIEKAWNLFKKRRLDSPPEFFYRPKPHDPSLLKRTLHNIPIERVEDPTLERLFREKRRELDRQLTMLNDRGHKKFLYGSLQLFGEIDADLLSAAKEILQHVSPHSRETSSGGGTLKAEDFARRARAEIAYYRRMFPELSAQVTIHDDIVGLMVSQGNLRISRNVRIPASRADALLQHEIGTHVLTYFNGWAQPFKQLFCGLAGYEELQEGLAVLAEFFAGGLSRPRVRLLAGRVVAAHCLVQGAQFIETFRTLNKDYGFGQRTAFIISARTYRGGGFTKDAVYLRGLIRVLAYLQKGGKLEPLFTGKIAANHIPVVQELQWRKVLRSPPLRPHYFEFPQFHKNLETLRQGVSVLDLLQQKRRRK